MGMKAKVGLLALLVATVAGAIAFDKFRAKTASATDQVDPQKGDQPAAPEVAATPTGKGSGMTPVKVIVAAPKPPRPEAPKPPKPVAPTPPVIRPEPPKPPSPLPTDFTKADPPKPMDTWKPGVSTPPVETVKDTTPKPTEPSSGVDIVNRTEPPSGLGPTDVIRPPAEATPNPVAPTPIAPDTYEVAAGDSLYVISQKVYGTHRHWRAIFDANRDTLEAEDRLVVGKKIRIPKIAAAPAPKAPEVAAMTPPVELAGRKTHVVKAGDSLSTISKLYFKESRFWEKIAAANSKFLKDPHNLKVGDVLIIPEIEAAPAVKAPEATPFVEPPAASPELAGKKIHTVGEGDSLSTISQKHFGTTKHWKAIFEANRKVLSSPDALSVGMNLVIPEIAATPAPAAGTPSSPKAPSVPAELAALGTPYTVQEGDTLTSIAEKFLGSQNEWARISALNVGITMKDADHLSVGMVIVIPKAAEKPAPAPPKAPMVEKPVPKSPGLEKIDSLPPTAKKGPEPPRKEGDGGSTGSKFGIE